MSNITTARDLRAKAISNPDMELGCGTDRYAYMGKHIECRVRLDPTLTKVISTAYFIYCDRVSASAIDNEIRRMK